MLNFKLTNEEHEALGRKYETNDPEKFFNYVSFCASINRAFTTTGIEKVPVARVAPVTQNDTLLARRKYLQSGNGDENDLSQILDEYRKAVKVRGIYLKPVFQDYDKTKCGHVTKAQFLRVVDLLKISAPDNVTQMVLRRYMDKGNIDEVNYFDFCNDVDGSDNLFGVGRDFNHSFDYFPKTQPRVNQGEILRNSPEDLEDVLARIRTICKQRRIRVDEFFRDFDKLRTGYITNAQFRIGLSMAKILISAAEFILLTTQFKAPKEGEHIRWREFSDQVDQVFSKKGLEKQLDVQLDDVRTSTNYGRRDATEQEREIVNDIVLRFQEVVKKNRLDSKSFFQDFDKHRSQQVSQKIFRQVLTTHGFPLSESEVANVALVYGSANNEVKYVEFLKDCAVLKYTINGPTTGAKSTYNPNYTDFKGANEFNELMEKIKNTIKKDRIRLLEFFQDHDLLRKGTLPPQKFRSVLNTQKV